MKEPIEFFKHYMFARYTEFTYEQYELAEHCNKLLNEKLGDTVYGQETVFGNTFAWAEGMGERDTYSAILFNVERLDVKDK